jgi:hypothetical protein
VSVPALAFALASATYLGFQATIRLVVYPQFARVPSAGFAAYERAHQRGVTVLVAPLFAFLVLSSAAVALLPPAGAPRALALAALVPTAALLALTGAGAVPQHRRLESGFDEQAHRRLLLVDTLRLVAAAAGTVVAVLLVLS